MSEAISFIIVLALSLAGGLAKAVGGALYGSKSLIVDATTCFANLVVALVMVLFYRLSLKAPDADHTYGHKRFRLASIAVATSTYSLVLGVLVAYLFFSFREKYVVETQAPVLATIGALFYGLAIMIGRRLGREGEVYAKYTYGEILESLVTVLASLGGSLYYYFIDLLGAVLLVVFWTVETTKNMLTLVNIIAERVEPALTMEVRKYLEDKGYTVKSLRFRDVGDRLIGDLTIELPSYMSVEEAHEIASTVEKELAGRFRLEVTVHVEPKE
ncbi:MAG: cation transporter dimerization domain-containing protein [Acidilobaceae archaeon]